MYLYIFTLNQYYLYHMHMIVKIIKKANTMCWPSFFSNRRLSDIHEFPIFNQTPFTIINY
jgi:hypothetical protein